VPILNVCAERLAELERRKKVLSYRIAVQRAELETGFRQLRKPLHALDTAKSIGSSLIEHAPAIAMVLGPLLFLLRRPLAGSVGFAARLVKRATRWWAMWKVGTKLLNKIPISSRRRGYAR
jgi:hypothetical protein